ncbi:MAG: biotin--[acetyl-CoA-carboxylase] ligase [Elusimicrobia bacterium]|nr:biotin--[acetyl-CoA-carboxylase] ligase [Elusimicrobiota bacterium]
MSELLPDWEAPVVHLTSAESTQDLAREMAEKRCPEWTLVIADKQSHGRGRLGRKWGSSKGGLYFSMVLRPEVPPTALAHLSLTTASAVAKALSSISGLQVAVKPPNDVLAAPAGVDGTGGSDPGPEDPATGKISVPLAGKENLKKVCGILAEASGSSTKTDWVVLGIGINVNNRVPKSLPRAGVLSELAGREFVIKDVLNEVLAEFRREYAQFLNVYRRNLS